jgi:hypothetical protein
MVKTSEDEGFFALVVPLLSKYVLSCSLLDYEGNSPIAKLLICGQESDSSTSNLISNSNFIE